MAGPRLTLEQFEEMVAAEAAYQRSREGRIARKIGEFQRSFVNSVPTEEQQKDFYKALDKEFGTDLYDKNFDPVETGYVRYSWDKHNNLTKVEKGPPQEE